MCVHLCPRYNPVEVQHNLMFPPPTIARVFLWAFCYLRLAFGRLPRCSACWYGFLTELPFRLGGELTATTLVILSKL